jgi:peptide-methionine (S)-S-oxide reductase
MQLEAYLGGVDSELTERTRVKPNMRTWIGQLSRNTALVLALATLIPPLAAATQSGGASPPSAQGMALATFAGGCFWCMEPPFDELDGVIDTTSGYTGGHVKNPSYEQVSAGGTGHAEAVQVTYDPARVSYQALLDVYWHNVDPTDAGGQFCDRGSQYRTAIFYHDEEQRRLAEASKAKLEQSGQLGAPIVTEIVPAGPFYPAEEYHQDYYRKNKLSYTFYRWNCGRDERLRALWGDAAPHPE